MFGHISSELITLPDLIFQKVGTFPAARWDVEKKDGSPADDKLTNKSLEWSTMKRAGTDHDKNVQVMTNAFANGDVGTVHTQQQPVRGQHQPKALRFVTTYGAPHPKRRRIGAACLTCM